MSKSKVNTQIQEINTVVTNEDGEIVSQDTELKSSTVITESQSDYVKLYFSDIRKLMGLTSQESSILYAIMELIQYNTNLVILNKYIREKNIIPKLRQHMLEEKKESLLRTAKRKKSKLSKEELDITLKEYENKLDNKNKDKTLDQVIRNAISKFVKMELLLKQGTGTYVANPYIFGRGDWTSIKKIRMEIEYNNQGRKIKTITEPEEVEFNQVSLKDYEVVELFRK